MSAGALGGKPAAKAFLDESWQDFASLVEAKRLRKEGNPQAMCSEEETLITPKLKTKLAKHAATMTEIIRAEPAAGLTREELRCVSSWLEY
jgi:hypothetical protein